jgi:hypothetical protein
MRGVAKMNRIQITSAIVLVVALGLVPEASSAGAKTPIDGTYRAHTTAAMILAVGGQPDEANSPGNLGNYQYVFDRGRFAFTQEYKNACTWQYGHFTVHGGTLTMSFVNGGGIGTDAYNRPGELFKFGWKLYRGALSLTVIKGAVSPAPTRSAPLQLVSKTPMRSYLNKRCQPPASALPR